MFYSNASLLNHENEDVLKPKENNDNDQDKEDCESIPLTTSKLGKDALPNNPLIPNYQLVLFPTTYFLSSLFTLFYFLMSIHINNILNDHPTINMERPKYTIPNYFALQEANDIIFKINTYLRTFSLLFIVIAFYIQINQRFKVPEFKSCLYQIYTILFIGCFCILFNFGYGYADEIRINLPFLLHNQNKYNERKIIFLCLVLCNILYNSYSLYIMRNVAKKEEGRSSYPTNWWNYCCFILVVLIFAVIGYLVLGLKIDGIILEPEFKNKTEYFYMMSPYVIYILNSLQVSCNYFILKYLNSILKQNMNMDYLFIGGNIK